MVKILRYSLAGEKAACLRKKDRVNGTHRKRLHRNRRGRARKFKSGESKLGSCMDKVRELRPLLVTISETLKSPR